MNTSPGGIVTTARFAVARTVSERVPDAPLALAEMFAEPAVTPVTSPVLETIATTPADDVHWNVVLTVLPTESRATAVSCALSPTAIVGWGDDTKMLAMRTDGPLLPSPQAQRAQYKRVSETMRRSMVWDRRFTLYDDRTRDAVSQARGVARRCVSQN